MIDPDNVPPVSDDEGLARFVTQSKQFRSDGTVKPDLFIPYRHVELSVTRHLEATQEEIWSVGFDIANAFERTLHGRADILASSCKVDTCASSKSLCHAILTMPTSRVGRRGSKIRRLSR